MKTTLEKALQLDKSDFIQQLVSFNQEKVINTLHDDINLRNRYQNKAVELYTDDIAKQDFVRNVELGKSKALLSLLNPEQRGWVLYFSSIRGQNFKAAYNAVELGYADNNNIKKFFSTVVFDEINRLSNGDEFSHLENNIDYLGFIDKTYKPYTSPETYTFFLYVSFVLHVKNGFKINNQHFLNLVGLKDEKQNASKNFKKEYYNNCINLIKDYKEKLHFDLWTPELLGLFNKDINTPNPYGGMGISNNAYELEQFARYGQVLSKFLMKNDLDEKFPEKQHEHKKVKI